MSLSAMAFRYGTSDQEVITVLRGARELIQQGWTRGVTVRNPGTKKARYCLMGAIEMAAKKGGWNTSYDVLTFLHPFISGTGAFSVPHFNDSVAKSKKDVLKVLDKAIQQLENAHAS